MLKISFYSLLISFAVFNISCENKAIVYNNYYDFSNATWSHNDSIIFNWTVEDTNSIYNIDIQLRASNAYKWSNIFIFSDVFFPNGKARRDTMEYYLANSNGHWIGERSGLIVQYQFPIYKKIRLPLIGDYKFFIQQAMRDTVLNEILNVGIKITRLDN